MYLPRKIGRVGGLTDSFAMLETVPLQCVVNYVVEVPPSSTSPLYVRMVPHILGSGSEDGRSRIWECRHVPWTYASINLTPHIHHPTVCSSTSLIHPRHTWECNRDLCSKETNTKVFSKGSFEGPKVACARKYIGPVKVQFGVKLKFPELRHRQLFKADLSSIIG